MRIKARAIFVGPVFPCIREIRADQKTDVLGGEQLDIETRVLGLRETVQFVLQMPDARGKVEHITCNALVRKGQILETTEPKTSDSTSGREIEGDKMARTIVTIRMLFETPERRP